jgi:hypothetical protein
MPDHDQQLKHSSDRRVRSFEAGHAGARGFFPLAVGLVFVMMVTACSEGSGSRSVMSLSNISLLELLPEGTSTVLTVDVAEFNAEARSEDLRLLLQPGRDADPLLHKVASAIDSASAGLDPAEDFSNFVLAYLLTPQPSLLLLADSKENQIRTLFESQDIEELEDYRGTTLYLSSLGSRTVAMLSDGALCIGEESAVKRVIDGARDGDDSGADSRLTAALARESGQAPITFAMTMAANDDPGEPESGASTIEQAQMLAGGVSIAAGQLQGAARFHLAGAQSFVSRFNELADNDYGASLSAPDDETLEVQLTADLKEHFNRFLLKQLSFGLEAIAYTDATGVDANMPWLTFNVSASPHSIFINYTFSSEAQREVFEREVLPAGFRLTPMSIVSGEPPTYYLVLNIYGSSGGLVEGARAEWSVFVEDPVFGVPRFMVVEAVAASIAADPVNLLTAPENVQHVLSEGVVTSSVKRPQEDGGEILYFGSAFPEPAPGEQTVQLSPGFAAANDYIYWRNGVADRGVYNGSVYAGPVTLIDPVTFSVEDNSRWATYLNETPRHVLSYQNALEIIISPWFNLSSGDLDVTESHREALVEFSNNFYPMTAQGQALAAFNGAGDLTRPRVEATGTPSIYFHFLLHDPQGLQDAVSGSTSYKLAPIALADGDVPQHYVTLQVYTVQDDACGLSADWVTYVENSATLHLARHSSRVCVDADTLFRPPARVELDVQGSRHYLDVESIGNQFAASIDFDLGVDVRPGIAWVTTTDDQCSLGGYCDRVFYDGDSLVAPLREVDPSAVDISTLQTQWDDFIESQPVSVMLRGQPRLLVTLPWTNVQPSTSTIAPASSGE